jgi:hypothetical protein
MRPQPVLIAALLALAGEAMALMVAFGVDITADQRVAILGVIGAGGTLAGLGLAWWASRKVTPLASPRDEQGRVLLPGPDAEKVS